MRASTAILLGIGALILLIGGVAGLAAVVGGKKAGRAKSVEPAAATPTTAKDAPPPAGPEPTALELWARADVREVSAEALWKAYQEGNAVATDRQYKGKLLGLYGTVRKVDSVNGQGALVLAGGGGDDLLGLDAVVCLFDAAHTDILADLAEGDVVAVAGECQGKSLQGPAVAHCKLVGRAKTADQLLPWIKQQLAKKK